MRISTNTIYTEGISRISDIQSEQVKLQSQIATGKKFNTASEAPIEAARALELSTHKHVNDTYGDVRKIAENSLTLAEGNLSSITDHILSAQSQLIGAGNGALSDNERGYIARELQNTLESLVGIANTQDSSGKYLFSGYSTNVQPFTLNTGTGRYEYQGDTNDVEVEVAPNTNIGVSFDGAEVFQNGTDVFAELQDMIALLNTPITDATTRTAYDNGLENAIGKMKNYLTETLNVRATVGGRLNQIESLNVSGSATDLQYQTALSDLQDLDYAQALSQYTKTEIMLEAAQKTFTSTAKLSLFDYI